MGIDMTEPVARLQALDQGANACIDRRRERAARGPQQGVHQLVQGDDVRRRWCLVNGEAKRRDDRTRFPRRHCAGPREVQQGRPVEARQDDTEAPLHGHRAQHFRRRAAGTEDGVGHARLVPTEPPRNVGLEQLHDLAGRPGVDVRRGALADLLPDLAAK